MYAELELERERKSWKKRSIKNEKRNGRKTFLLPLSLNPSLNATWIYDMFAER